MRFDNSASRIQKYSQDLGTLLAVFGLVRALKAADLLKRDTLGFVIFVVPKGFRTEEYETAAFAILGATRGDWMEQNVKVRPANPPRKKQSPHKRISIFDIKGLDVLLAKNIDEVPKDVRFAATAVMFVDRPTPQHINAVRRLSGREPLSHEVAALIAAKPQNVIMAAVLKPNLIEDRIDEINDLSRRETGGASLFELPGYDELKPWAKKLFADVVRWRAGTLDWKLVTRGALISGPPGTGKTLFAEGLANALGIKLISTTVGSWQAEGHLDDMLAAMRKSFNDADDGEGSVLFIDELDGIGSRTARVGQNEIYWRNVINEFLSLLSSLGDGVVVIGATNFPEWIDPAILRDGRLENHFELTLPDQKLRTEILKHHAGEGLSFESLFDIAEDLKGRSGAVLERIVRDAREVARNEDRELELRDIRNRLPEKIPYTAEQQLRMAVHEAGHALVSLSLQHSTSATIEIKDSFDPNATEFIGGMTSYTLIDDYFPTETTLLNRIAVSLAGMASEAAIFGDRSIGSGGNVGSDVERATTVARRLIGTYGLGKVPIYLGTPKEVEDVRLPERVQAEVSEIVVGQWERVLAILKKDHERVFALAVEVVTHGTVTIEKDSIAASGQSGLRP
ncbi:AAA family ATPase [Agrobacterium tumefaciens]|uniref:AAA family ATPase n=1 Tax=Agrobacterium tumefaciens TaxID=358 RepID=UPI002AFF1768|nr:AAA family ATPase [Agrobacterium tumefaciens]MEA1842968.1 AAA family ATPase [Agrobacterium tumefaciens]